MDQFFKNLVTASIEGKIIAKDICLKILNSKEIELLPLLNAAFEVRKKYKGMEVTIHILDNVQNGLCSQDCFYCAQSKNSTADIEKYSMKPDDEIMAEAKEAYESGAFRHCLVFSGKGPSQERIEHLATLVKRMKSNFQMEICVSPGFISKDQARILKGAGVDRINHNINTSENYYSKICTTHTYQDRINTIHAAKSVGLALCSGVIIGMGESDEDIIAMAAELRKVGAASIPVNFFIPITGTAIADQQKLTPEYCLRILCLFRFINPEVEIRIAAGRELHLRSMEAMALYPANSLFMEGYLNTNLFTALSSNSDIGTIRETYFASNVFTNYSVYYCDKGDFIVEEKFTFEIGGKNKGFQGNFSSKDETAFASFEQIKDIPNSFVIADDIEIGFGNKIPLWLFGFLY